MEFLLVPMPRLEIETIQDFKILHEIGALTPDMTVKLSRILLGEEPGAARKSSSAQPGKVQQLSAAEPFPEKHAGPDPDKKSPDAKPPASGKAPGAKPPSKP